MWWGKLPIRGANQGLIKGDRIWKGGWLWVLCVGRGWSWCERSSLTTKLGHLQGYMFPADNLCVHLWGYMAPIDNLSEHRQGCMHPIHNLCGGRPWYGTVATFFLWRTWF